MTYVYQMLHLKAVKYKKKTTKKTNNISSIIYPNIDVNIISSSITGNVGSRLLRQ